MNIFSENTKKTYKAHVDTYTRFCLFMGFPAVHATSFRVAVYAAFLARTPKASGISQYLSTVGLLHNEYGLPNPLIDNYCISSLLRGIKRVKGNSCAQKLPIMIDLLYRIWHQLNLRCSFQASFWAICLTAFFGMFRKSNLLPVSRSSFDPNKQLTKADFVFESWGVLVHMKGSKTIQFREKVVLIPFSYVPHSLCARFKLFVMLFPVYPLIWIVPKFSII